MEINLVLLKRNGSRKSYPLPSSVTVIGRRSDCDLRIPLMSVSKRHCELNHNKGILKIRDLGSRNGTVLNGKPIDEAVVQAGDSIKIGPLAFVLQVDGQPKTIVHPNSSEQNSPHQDKSTEDLTKDQFGDFTEDDLDSLLSDSDLSEANGTT